MKTPKKSTKRAKTTSPRNRTSRKTIAISISIELVNSIQKFAEDQHRSVSSVAEECIASHLPLIESGRTLETSIDIILKKKLHEHRERIEGVEASLASVTAITPDFQKVMLDVAEWITENGITKGYSPSTEAKDALERFLAWGERNKES